jgi:hypothetical protein
MTFTRGFGQIDFEPDTFGVGQEHCHFPVKNTASLKYDYSNN